MVLRLYQVYGPKQDFNRLIPIVIKNCINNKKFNCSEGIQFRDFIYVEDVVSAILLALEKKKAHGKIFNVGTSKRIKIKNLIDNINKQVGKGVPLYGKIKLRNDENIVSYPSITKVKRILNWQPKIHFNYGLKKLSMKLKKEKKNKRKILVSVIMNCHNCEKYLSKSVKSVLQQTYKDLELIFYDNQSSDKSIKIIRNFKDKRIRILKSKNFVKLYKARNAAIKKSKGEFIAFLDTDDWWHRDRLKNQIKLIKYNKEIKILYSKFYIYDQRSKKKKD